MPQGGNKRSDSTTPQRAISLVGLMGVGKTTIGRRLAKRLDLPFYDSDAEIEKASGRTIKGYFKDHGEASFRDGELRVIKRLLNGPPIVLSTGGGAFTNAQTRAALNAQSLTIWLKADLDTIMARVSKNLRKRPLLNVPNPQEVMRNLMKVRHPQYAQAAITVMATGLTHGETVEKIIEAIQAYEAEQEKQAKVSANKTSAKSAACS